jgi:hypothetical protein
MRECIICHQLKDDNEFYHSIRCKSHMPRITYPEIISKECKDCMCNDIDVYDYNTYDKYLKELDLPYFEEEWNALIKRYYVDSAKAIMGRYNSKMKLCSFSCYRYEDNEHIKELEY